MKVAIMGDTRGTPGRDVPGAGRSTPPPAAQGRDLFRDLWFQWTAVVEQFALRHRSRLRVPGRGYQQLHQALLGTCRYLADQADEPLRVRYRTFERMARPWLNLQVLAQTDREILFDLLQRCREVGRELGTPWRIRLRPWLNLALALTGLAAGAVLVGWAFEQFRLPLLGELRHWLYTLVRAAGETTATQRWYALGVILILLAIWLVNRTARS